VPDAPGQGVRVDWDAVAEHPREKVHFDLGAEDWHFREARR
jgi:galactonate dehydratase